jgi:DNA-binding transcriptional ArsR family regulator
MALDAGLLNALASPLRQEILRLTWREERTAGAIHQAMPDVTFGAVSLQLKALLEAGLIEARLPKKRKRRFY